MKWVFFGVIAIVSTALTGSLLAGAPPPLPWLGVSFTWSQTDGKTHMLHVRHITRGGPAERAGVRDGDLISTIDGNRVARSR